MVNVYELKIDAFSTLITHKSHRNCIELSNRFQAKRDDSDFAFDRPSSFLAVFHQPALIEIGCLLDSRIESVVHAVKNNYR
jgi:hypothetical protein